MIALSRRRPVSVTLFAVFFFGTSLFSCLIGLLNIPSQQLFLIQLIPAVTWSSDAVIVWQSAWLSIALIPIAMVWLAAVRFARWLVTMMALAKLIGLLMDLPVLAVIAGAQPLWLASLGLIAVALLFTPESNRWFKYKGGDDPAIFE
jgi:hypothetical protein